jgi:hypothetical protein
MTLRKHRLRAFFEPKAVVTYLAPPPWAVEDIPLFKFRWDPRRWQTGNRAFCRKWQIQYRSSRKRASYRVQRIRLGLAARWPTRFNIGLANQLIAFERFARSRRAALTR